jgi:CRISPR-associated protein Csm3
MRSLLARDKGTLPAWGVRGFEEDCFEIKRLFGSSSDTSNAAGTGMQMSRLQFCDCFLSNEEELKRMQVPIFETKFENTIDRLSSVANPRQMERVVRGAKFGFELIYNVEDPDELEEDFANIRLGLDLIENDYLGGGGTRGNGRVRFTDLTARVVTGDPSVKIPELR